MMVDAYGFFAVTFIRPDLLKHIFPGIGPFSALAAGIACSVLFAQAPMLGQGGARRYATWSQPGGSIEHWNEEAGSVWMQRLTRTWPHHVWLNPEPEQRCHAPEGVRREDRAEAERTFGAGVGDLEARADDDVGAHVSEHHAAGGPRHDLCKFEYPHSGERAGMGRFCVHRHLRQRGAVRSVIGRPGLGLGRIGFRAIVARLAAHNAPEPGDQGPEQHE